MDLFGHLAETGVIYCLKWGLCKVSNAPAEEAQ